MNREELYESIGGIDEDLLERSEKTAASGKRAWKVLLPLAACFCVVLLSAALLGQNFFTVEPTVPTDSSELSQQTVETTQQPTETTLKTTETTEPTRETVPPISPDSWEVVYNDGGSGIDALIAAPFGHFTEKMSREQIKLLLPDALLERTDIEGRAHYKAGNEVWFASIVIPIGEYSVSVRYKENPTCLLGGPEGTTSVCGDVEYLVMEETREKKITKEKYIKTETPGVYWVEEEETGEVEVIIERLRAVTTINGVPMFFFMDVESKCAEEEKKIFKEILTAFATYPEGMPAIDEIKPMEPRNSYYYNYSLEEARKDETVGSYLPQQIPETWEIYSVERYFEESSKTDKLELAVMTEKQAFLYWRMSAGDSDTVRLYSRAEMENLLMQQGYIDINYGEVTVSVWFGEYNKDKIDYQWICDQLILLQNIRRYRYYEKQEDKGSDLNATYKYPITQTWG